MAIMTSRDFFIASFEACRSVTDRFPTGVKCAVEAEAAALIALYVLVDQFYGYIACRDERFKDMLLELADAGHITLRDRRTGAVSALEEPGKLYDLIVDSGLTGESEYFDFQSLCTRGNSWNAGLLPWRAESEETLSQLLRQRSGGVQERIFRAYIQCDSQDDVGTAFLSCALEELAEREEEDPLQDWDQTAIAKTAREDFFITAFHAYRDVLRHLDACGGLSVKEAESRVRKRMKEALSLLADTIAAYMAGNDRRMEEMILAFITHGKLTVRDRRTGCIAFLERPEEFYGELIAGGSGALYDRPEDFLKKLASVKYCENYDYTLSGSTAGPWNLGLLPSLAGLTDATDEALEQMSTELLDRILHADAVSEAGDYKKPGYNEFMSRVEHAFEKRGGKSKKG